jgi:hypothetical protein
MRRRHSFGIFVFTVIIPVIAVAAQSIPDAQLDTSRVFYGSPAAFDKPAEVDIDAAIQSTPEYQEIVKKKIDSGTGKYWILISEATDRVHRAISDIGKVNEYDLIAQKGYLGALEPPVSCVDITGHVLEAIEQN